MVKARIRSLWLGAVLSVAQAACSPEPRCTPVHRCDIRDEACQQMALRHAACLRGLDEDSELSVAVQVMSTEEFVQRERESAQESDEAYKQMRRGLALFGLQEWPVSLADSAEERARLVGAYYDSVERRITVLDFGYRHGASDVPLLVHEMVHALQDAAGQLGPNHDALRFDEALARGAMIEGEATILEDEAITLGYQFDFESLDYAHALAHYRRYAKASASHDRSPFETARMRFSYAFGASYLWPLRERDGPSALAQVYDAFPVSTFAVMSRVPGRRPNDLGDMAVPVLDDSELTLVGTYHLGRFLYEAGVGTRATRIPEYVLPWADAFIADTLSVFADEQGRVLAAYRVRFDSEEAVRHAADYIESEALAPLAGVDGRDVWWFQVEDEPASGNVPDLLGWRAAPEADFGYGSEDPPARARRFHCLREHRGQ
jgi:hypothetical protein